MEAMDARQKLGFAWTRVEAPLRSLDSSLGHGVGRGEGDLQRLVAEHTTALYELGAGEDGVNGELTVATTASGLGVTYEPIWAELEMRNDGVEVPAPEELP